VWTTETLTHVLTPTAIALGNFDGLHRGHRAVIDPILYDPNRWATVVTFRPHPVEYFSGQPRALLTPLPEKQEILASWGVQQLVLLTFDREWRIQDLPPVWSDPELLVPILVQLLDYALTHTPLATRVQVRGWPGGTGVQIGVPELDLGELWYPLGPSRPGMGLYVTQMLVERLQGRLLLGQGLTLELPRAARMTTQMAGFS